jgi:tetratricopeptide (TPR) repeat protein
MSSLSASPTVAAKATPLPRLYINHLPELDWLIAVEFGRTDDGQSSDHWLGLCAEIGILLDEPGGKAVGFKINTFSKFDEISQDIEGVWDGPRFHSPQLGMPDASIGEIITAARATFGEHQTVNRAFFSAAALNEGEEALGRWRCCLEAGDSMAHYGIGYTLYELGRFHEAYRHLRYYTEIAPASAWTWYWYGRAAESIGENDEAIAAFQRACEIEAAGGEETDAAELLTLLEAKLEGAR